MTTDKRALAAILATGLAVPAEGLRQWAYYDPPGILTVCRGHTGPDVIAGKKYSLAECDQYLSEDMKKAIKAVDTCVPGLPVEVLAAFGDAVFNLGPKIACDTRNSHAALYLRNHLYERACNELPLWNKARVLSVPVALPGLTKRRAQEQTLCLKGLPS